jgi:mRNA interferase MazF
VIRRGEVRWARLPAPVGADPGPRLPVLIVSSDAFNASRIGTVLAVVVSSRLELAAAPGNVLLPARATGLPRDAVANVAQVVTLDRAWVGEQVGSIAAPLMAAVGRGLQLVAGLHPG